MENNNPTHEAGKATGDPLLENLLQQDNFDGVPMMLYHGFWIPKRNLKAMVSSEPIFKGHDTDIVLASQPKAGTTWMKALIFSIINRHQFPISQSPLLTTSPHKLLESLECGYYFQLEANPDLQLAPDPTRFYSTHLSYQLLPSSLLRTTSKIVYITRNPLDQFISEREFLLKAKFHPGYEPLPIGEAFDMFCGDVHAFGPFWDHFLGYWKASLENPDRVLFLKYEDLKMDPLSNLDKIADFLGMPFSEEKRESGVMGEILDLCSFQNLKNLEVNKTGVHLGSVNNESFYRKGEIGDWKNHLTPEMALKLKQVVDDKLNLNHSGRVSMRGIGDRDLHSHRIFDSRSLGIFLAAWANATTPDGRLVIRPNFDSLSYFPPEYLGPHQFQVSRTPHKNSIVPRRYVFDKTSTAKLRDKLSTTWKSSGIQLPPSRVVMVSAVLTQAMLRADRAKHGKSRASLIGQVIDVRERTIPPLPKNSCGTWVVETFLELTEEESRGMEQNFAGVALKMLDVVVQGVKDCARILSDRVFGRRLMVDSFLEGAQKADSPNYKAIFITDFSKFGEYEVDFGFGKPVWVSMAAVPLEDHFILLNTKNNDRIEAWVYLHESDKRFFEQDEDLRMLTDASDFKNTSTFGIIF